MNVRYGVLRIVAIVLTVFVAVLMASAQPTDPLAVTNVTPAQTEAGTAVTITVEGTGFDTDAVVSLDGGVGNLVTTVVSQTELTATVPNTVPAGVYTVIVTNVALADSASLSNAFSVNMPTATPTVTAIPTSTPAVLAVTVVEPARVNLGDSVTVSVLGNNFTAQSTVRIVGVGVLSATFVNSGVLTVQLPGNVPAGHYDVEVSDPVNGSAVLNQALRVVAPPPPTDIPAPTAEPAPSVTPIQVVNEPALALTNFVAQPSVVEPGQIINLTFSLANLGTEIARTVIVSLGSGSSFVPAGGQASLALPDMLGGAVYNGQMSISAALDIADGPVRIPLVVTYQDYTGKTYTTNAELSVTVRSVVSQSQVLVEAYTIDPSPSEPGQPVMVRMTIVNLGNELASQVSLRFNGSDNVLLPSGSGDTFIVGDLNAGQRAPMIIPLIIAPSAKSGQQVQTLTLNYAQGDEAKEVTTTITVPVAAVEQPQPLLLISRYSTSEVLLQPGSQFTLDVELQNAGAAAAHGVVVTFGTVESSGGVSSGGDGSEGNSGSTQSNTTPSTTFAPLGTAGLFYLGDIDTAQTVSVSQDFLIAGTVSTGIYNLPVTLQYSLPDGSENKVVLNISMVVIVPPRLRINMPMPLPEMATAGEPISLSLLLQNIGKNDVNLTHATVSATNAEILDGAEIELERVKVDDDTSVDAMLMPLEEGEVEITVTLHYLNELNQSSSIVETYTVLVMPAPPPIEPDPIEPEPVEPEPEPAVDWFGQGLLALLGLGS